LQEQSGQPSRPNGKGLSGVKIKIKVIFLLMKNPKEKAL